MARRNQNTFLKRQKEIERMRKAKEKMDKRQGKVIKREEESFGAPSDEPVEGLSPEDQPPGEVEADGTSPAPESDEKPDDENADAV